MVKKEPTYIPDIFYDTSQLDFDTKVEIIEDAFGKKYKWWVDVLDCSKSWARQRVVMSFKEIMEKFDDKAYFTVIYRKGYTNNRGFPDPGDGYGYHSRWHLEVGFRSSYTVPVEWFLWIYCPEDKVESFVNKYNLEALL